MKEDKQLKTDKLLFSKKSKIQKRKLFKKIDQLIDENKNEEGSLIKLLHQTQELNGYLPRDILIYIAENTGIPFAEIYGVVSFYSLFSMKPGGKYRIEVCMGTACYVKGSEKILNKLKKTLNVEPGDVTDDGLFVIETTRCRGACSLAPVLAINDDIYGGVTVDEIENILDRYKKKGVRG